MRTIFNFVFMLSIAAIFLSCGDDSNPADNSIPNINITALIPANNATKVSTNSQTFQITFDDTVTKGTGSIRIYLEDGDLLFSSLDVGSGVTFSKNKVTFKFSKRLEIGKKHYILIDKGAFLFDVSKEYSGINNKTVWTFASETVEEKPELIMCTYIRLGLEKVFLSDPDYTYSSIFMTDYIKVSGEMFTEGFDTYEMSIVFPNDLSVNTNYDLSNRKGDQVYKHHAIGGSNIYLLQSGSLRLLTKNSEYCEGEFSFLAIKNIADAVTVNKGYFFAKYE